MNPMFLNGKGNSAFASNMQSALQGNIFLSYHLQVELGEFYSVRQTMRLHNGCPQKNYLSM